MPRSPRIFLPDVSVHVIQRGNNKRDIFSVPEDYRVFLELLRRSATRHRVAVHAYVLMTNHFHLLATPSESQALPAMMKALDGGYVRYFNRHYQRIGTIWNGRYRALPILDERYWLTCLRYIEQNPVRAGLSSVASAYRWSSARAHVIGDPDNWLTTHPVFDALGIDCDQRQAAYRQLSGELVDSLESVFAR